MENEIINLKRCKVKITLTTRKPKIPYSIAAHSINDKIDLIIVDPRQEWKTIWLASTQYKHTKNFHSGPDHNRAKRTLKLSRSDFIAIITGFNRLSYI